MLALVTAVIGLATTIVAAIAGHHVGRAKNRRSNS